MHVCVESASSSSSSSSSVGWIQKPLEKKSKIMSMKKCPYRGKKRRDRGEGCVDDATGTIVITRGHFLRTRRRRVGCLGVTTFGFVLFKAKQSEPTTYRLGYYNTATRVPMCTHDFFLIHASGCRLILCDRVRAMCPDGLNQRRRFGEYQTGVGTAKPKGIRYGGSSVGAEANAGADDG